MAKESGFSYDIQYTKAAEKFFRKHEDIRTEYESSIKELLSDQVRRLPCGVYYNQWNNSCSQYAYGRFPR